MHACMHACMRDSKAMLHWVDNLPDLTINMSRIWQYDYTDLLFLGPACKIGSAKAPVLPDPV